MMKRALLTGVCVSVSMCIALGVVTLSHTPARDIDEWRVRALSTHDWTSMTKLRATSWARNDAAMFALGTVLVSDANPQRARDGLRWLERSAQSGNPDAQLTLGRAFFDGVAGTPLDYARSRAWLERAAHDVTEDAPASAGAQATYWLASIHRNGYGVPRNADAGLRWLERAARSSVPQAQFQLANIYRERGDDARALDWLRRSAAAEYAEANLALAMAYRNGELGLHRDEGEYWSYVKETLHDYKHRVQ
ncbi:TPR repeat, SEL1 subfamily [Candidatus Burkholderia humilis]|nr:TPR repeat, SEL1 subfamily [Candidatus Burkholderia humilis]